MAVYYIVIFFLGGLGYLATERNNKGRAVQLYLAAAFAALIFLTSFRYGIGFDYFAYRNIYDMMAGWTMGDIFHFYWYEPCFFILCRIFNLAGCSYQVFLLFINCFLLLAALWFIYRFSQKPWISVYLYITLQFLAYNMNLLRQSIAVSFFLLAYPYLKDRKLVLYTIFIAAGGLFHNSLLFLFPFYFLLPRKHTWKIICAMTASAVLVYVYFDRLFVLLQPVIPAKYAAYQVSYFWYASTVDYVVPSALYGILIFLFRSRIADPFRRTVCLNSALYHFLISLFITKHFILERFAVYPFVFSLIGIPEIIASFHSKKEQADGKDGISYYGVLLLFLVFGGAYFLFAARKGFHHVYPYISLLDQSGSTPR